MLRTSDGVDWIGYTIGEDIKVYNPEVLVRPALLGGYTGEVQNPTKHLRFVVDLVYAA
jgi:hypothetical protein